MSQPTLRLLSAMLLVSTIAERVVSPRHVSPNESDAFAACIAPTNLRFDTFGSDLPYITCPLAPSTGVDEGQGQPRWCARIRGASVSTGGTNGRVQQQLVVTQGVDIPYCAESYDTPRRSKKTAKDKLRRHCTTFGGDFAPMIAPSPRPILVYTHPWSHNFEHFHLEMLVSTVLAHTPAHHPGVHASMEPQS